MPEEAFKKSVLPSEEECATFIEAIKKKQLRVLLKVKKQLRVFAQSATKQAVQVESPKKKGRVTPSL
ncbi:hypothetical protein NPIL_50531 [Nephila pilipes]|uniref:Uncharacterized protein n=1 Tax=Nephila pilipes TaxID=299642 RepID=A0A8X6R3P6_NEPPI|nr:hypothetical protein NPIL_50531 [Nephila pilipes]